MHTALGALSEQREREGATPQNCLQPDRCTLCTLSKTSSEHEPRDRGPRAPRRERTSKSQVTPAWTPVQATRTHTEQTVVIEMAVLPSFWAPDRLGITKLSSKVPPSAVLSPAPRPQVRGLYQDHRSGAENQGHPRN